MQTCQSIVLVTPVWNDSKRLAIFAPELGEAIRDSNLPILWVIADDGSNKSERLKYEEITDYVRRLGCQVDTIRLKDRSFKGGVIYEAWNNYPQADWLAFVDADGAVSAKSILDLIYLAREKGEDACVVAVRSDQEKQVRRSYKRRCSCYLFMRLVQFILGLELGDTQCGAKVISGPMYRNFASQLRESGYVFDVELLVLLNIHAVNLLHYTVEWEEKARGKIRLLRDGWSMLFGLLRIRRRLRSGTYNPLKS